MQREGHKQAEDDAFLEVSEQYDSVFKPAVARHYLAKRVSFLRQYLGKGSKVLDVGCGTGTILSSLLPFTGEAVGVDSSAGMLAVAAKKMGKRHGSNASFVKADATKLPFKKNSFELVYSVATFHHLKDREAVNNVISEMVRVTKKGGRIIIWDHNPHNPYWRILLKRLPQDTGNERLIGDAEYISNFKGKVRKMEILKQSFVPDVCDERTISIFKKLEKAVENSAFKLFCAHTVVVAVK